MVYRLLLCSSISYSLLGTKELITLLLACLLINLISSIDKKLFLSKVKNINGTSTVESNIQTSQCVGIIDLSRIAIYKI
jgi:hypothetical protein